MYRKKHSRYRVQNYPQFQASTGDFKTYPPVDKGRILYRTQLIQEKNISQSANFETVGQATNLFLSLFLYL